MDPSWIQPGAVALARSGVQGLRQHRPWTVALGAGLVSAAGVPVTTISGASSVETSVKVVDLPPESEGCRIWRL